MLFFVCYVGYEYAMCNFSRINYVMLNYVLSGVTMLLKAMHSASRL